MSLIDSLLSLFVSLPPPFFRSFGAFVAFLRGACIPRAERMAASQHRAVEPPPAFLRFIGSLICRCSQSRVAAAAVILCSSVCAQPASVSTSVLYCSLCGGTTSVITGVGPLALCCFLLRFAVCEVEFCILRRQGLLLPRFVVALYVVATVCLPFLADAVVCGSFLDLCRVLAWCMMLLTCACVMYLFFISSASVIIAFLLMSMSWFVTLVLCLRIVVVRF